MLDLIVTLDTESITPKATQALIEKGATIFRINGSFVPLTEIDTILVELKQCAKGKAKILLDLPGYKIRFSYLVENVNFFKNIPFKIRKDTFNHPEFLSLMEMGSILRCNDGMIKLTVAEIDDMSVTFVANRDSTIRRGKGVNIDGISYRPISSSLTQLDKDLIDSAVRTEIDYVGLSFVYDANDIKMVNKLLSGSNVKCIPKIESKESLKNIYEIIDLTDVIIVDRGDLAGEIGLSNIWEYQRKIIKVAKLLNKKVILATQFFTNMINKPLPSIAETDSFHDLLHQGIDGIQLSEETCLGAFSQDVVEIAQSNAAKLRNSVKDAEAGSVFWLLGPSAAGKTTIAQKVCQRLSAANIPAIHFDGDEIRNLFGPVLNFSKENRMLVVKALAYLAEKLSKIGYHVFVSALTAHSEARLHIQDNINNLFIVCIFCSIEECIRRDPKGLYKLALEKKIDTVVGINEEYVMPEKYDLMINSEDMDPNKSAETICNFFSKEYIQLNNSP